uniref:NADH-ubiquinone oxidoreductase chain 5 n=1 Tax=Gesiella jameensis TaxID=1960709 RepID=A0A8E7MIJ0_9ANNE|nr:NADH dehydrogenase subunit 5 [Gesiella jameensis]
MQLSSFLKSSIMLWSIFPWMLSMTIYLFYMNFYIMLEWNIMITNSMNISFPLIIDPWGCLFSSTVMFISANVMHFSHLYMYNDKYHSRFNNLILMFVLSMNCLIFIPNMICMLLGWDGLGITSFILVIYYQNSKALAAGMITVLMNRIGDTMIIISIAIMMNYGNWNINSLWETNWNMMLIMLILIAAITKSAQMPFSSWLPAAMAAPTPVSALVHSSTLVTAGVFILFRFHYILYTNQTINSLLIIISSITMLMASLTAISECDMKKIIALSTLSQLSIMMLSLSMNLPYLTFFHLITHALFKALLFLMAGSMIHYHHHSQDLRFMGNTMNSSPNSISMLLIANLALCGSPFLSGFYSKDLILEMSMFNTTNFMILMLFLISTLLTSCYTMRLLLSVLWNSSNSLSYQYLNDKSYMFLYPSMMLSMGAIMGGSMLNWLSFNYLNEPILPMMQKMIPLIIMFMGFYLAFNYTNTPLTYFKSFPFIHKYMFSMWFLEPLMSQGNILKPLMMSHINYKIMDNGWLEQFGSQFLFKIFKKNSHIINLMTSKPMNYYLMFSLISMFLIFI